MSADPDANESNQELLNRCKQGDPEAFAEWFEQRREPLRMAAKRKLGAQLLGRMDASDVVQEVFLAANRQLAELSEIDVPLDAWLQILLKQRVVDLKRKHLFASKRAVNRERRRSENGNEMDTLAQELVGSLTSPSMRAYRKEVQTQIRDLLDELADADQEVLLLRHFEGISNGEVAERLGCSVNAASNRYIRALSRLKRSLDTMQRANDGK